MGNQSGTAMTGNRNAETQKIRQYVIPKRTQESVVDFMMMKTNEVMEKFMTLPNAIKVGEGDKSFVYVPPTKPKSVLLVAHADTVFDGGNADIKIGLFDKTLESINPKFGIGADDRAGIAMLWKLRKTGHALLVPNMEERGCVGSRFLMESEEWRERINSHLFAIEMDRMNAFDLAFYDIATNDFKDYCEKQFPEYKRQYGSYTDIRVLCDDEIHKKDCLCGVNISIGYYGQHGSGEKLVYPEWQRTLNYLYKLLTSKEEIPAFKHRYDPKPVCNNTYWDRHPYRHPYSIASNDRDVADYRGHSMITVPKRNMNLTEELDGNCTDASDSTLVCPNPACEAMFDETEYRQFDNACPYCKETF
jgi:hypothetical protein